MHLIRMYAEDVIGGAITTIIGTAIVWLVSSYGTLTLDVLYVVAPVLFFAFFLIKFLTRWASFVFMTGLREARGLFIEIYIVEKNARRCVIIAPMVVYFDVWRDSLAIAGQAFERMETKTPNFKLHAHWHSLCIHPIVHKDDFHISYLHDGELVGEKPDEIPGTTACKLPRSSAMHCRRGYFCDLVQVNNALDDANGTGPDYFSASYFEVIRAPRNLEQEFFNGIIRRWERWACRLRLMSPREDTFTSFVNGYGDAVLANNPNAQGPIMQEAKMIVERFV